ncbi:MAG: hypothetical protein GXO42_01740 [bacterium]|nr:hypothetical protein [bacterium]
MKELIIKNGKTIKQEIEEVEEKNFVQYFMQYRLSTRIYCFEECQGIKAENARIMYIVENKPLEDEHWFFLELRKKAELQLLFLGRRTLQPRCSLRIDVLLPQKEFAELDILIICTANANLTLYLLLRQHADSRLNLRLHVFAAGKLQLASSTWHSMGKKAIGEITLSGYYLEKPNISFRWKALLASKQEYRLLSRSVIDRCCGKVEICPELEIYDGRAQLELLSWYLKPSGIKLLQQPSILLRSDRAKASCRIERIV